MIVNFSKEKTLKIIARFSLLSFFMVWHSRAVSEHVHLQRANARLGVLIWHSRTVGERLGKIQNKPYFSTVALYLALECSLWEHSGASAHLWRANARSYVLIWHSRAVGELLTYSAPMPDKVC